MFRFLTKKEVYFIYIAAPFIILVFIKSYFVPCTVDEGSGLEGGTLIDTFLYLGSKCSANNHLINTLWNQAVVRHIFPYQEWAMRLLNSFSFLIYCYVLAKISISLSKNTIFAILFFIFFLTNQFIFEYFSLARGYSISIASASLGIYLLFGNERNTFLAYLSLLLACFANFSFLYLTVSILLVNTIFIFFNYYKSKNLYSFFGSSHFLFSILFGIVFVTYFVPIGNKIMAYDHHIPGSDAGVWRGTIVSLINNITPQSYTNSIRILIKLLIFSSVAICSCLFTYKLFFMYKSKQKFDFGAKVWLSIVATETIILASHYIKGTSFPVNRAAIYLLVLYPWCLAWLFTEEVGYRKKLVLVSLLIYFIVQLPNMLLYACSDKNSSSDIPTVINRLSNEKNKVTFLLPCTSYRPVYHYIKKKRIKNILMNTYCGESAVSSKAKNSDYVLIDYTYEKIVKDKFDYQYKLKTPRGLTLYKSK